MYLVVGSAALCYVVLCYPRPARRWWEPVPRLTSYTTYTVGKYTSTTTSGEEYHDLQVRVKGTTSDDADGYFASPFTDVQPETYGGTHTLASVGTTRPISAQLGPSRPTPARIGPIVEQPSWPAPR